MSERGEPAREEREGDGAEDELPLRGGGGGEGGGRDEEGARRRKEKRGSSSSYSSSKRRKAKQALLFPVKKFEKLCLRSSGDGERRKKRTRAPPYDAVGTGCVRCFSAPLIPPDSPLRVDDPQKKRASYDDLVRSLLEKNDFYSPDCNVHRPFNDR